METFNRHLRLASLYWELCPRLPGESPTPSQRRKSVVILSSLAQMGALDVNGAVPAISSIRGGVKVFSNKAEAHSKWHLARKPFLTHIFGIDKL